MELPGASAAPTVTHRLVQVRGWRRRQVFELTEARTVKVFVKVPGREESFEVAVRGFKPEPTRSKRTPWGDWILFSPLFMLTLLILGSGSYAVLFSPGSVKDRAFVGVAFLLMSLIFLPICALLIQRATYRKTNVAIFSSIFGTRLVLWFNNPRREKYEAFVAALQTAIAAETIANPVAIPAMPFSLAAELQKLKDLQDRGVINEAEFQAAKKRLLPTELPGPVGFGGVASSK